MEAFNNPPLLKASAIQLGGDDGQSYEILTNRSEADEGSVPQPETKKRRRRILANLGSAELEKRKLETKQSHSIIEKRRRLKINREFEALKYLIPACRETGSRRSRGNNNNGNSNSSSGEETRDRNNGKIDGMHKLTILKSAVEYLLYLHKTIRLQSEMLRLNPAYDFDISFAEVQLNVNDYRNIDLDFDFSELYDSATGSDFQFIKDSDTQLPLPETTPCMAPVWSNLGRREQREQKDKDVPLSLAESRELRASFGISPLTRPIIGSSPQTFTLPDPALALQPSRMDLEARDATNTLLELRKSSNVVNLLN